MKKILLVIICITILLFVLLLSFVLCPSDIYTDDLSGWVGTYVFDEYYIYEWYDGKEYVKQWDCKITIYEGKGDYFADIEIEHQIPPITKIKAKVFGSEEWISLIFFHYTGIGVLSPRDYENDVLISFRKEKSDIYTYWGIFSPYTPENSQSNKIYFEKVDDSK